MKLAVDWQRPVPLTKGRRQGLIYNIDLDRFDPYPAVYVFARRWGRSYEALYVGKTKNVRRRLHRHLNNLRLMRHLEDARSGQRVVIVGHPATRGGQRIDRVLNVLERALIRHFLSEAHDLVNQQGVRIRRHEIESYGPIPRSFVSSRMYLEQERRG